MIFHIYHKEEMMVRVVDGANMPRIENGTYRLGGQMLLLGRFHADI